MDYWGTFLGLHSTDAWSSAGYYSLQKFDGQDYTCEYSVDLNKICTICSELIVQIMKTFSWLEKRRFCQKKFWYYGLKASFWLDYNGQKRAAHLHAEHLYTAWYFCLLTSNVSVSVQSAWNHQEHCCDNLFNCWIKLLFQCFLKCVIPENFS